MLKSFCDKINSVFQYFSYQPAVIKLVILYHLLSYITKLILIYLCRWNIPKQRAGDQNSTAHFRPRSRWVRWTEEQQTSYSSRSCSKEITWCCTGTKDSWRSSRFIQVYTHSFIGMYFDFKFSIITCVLYREYSFFHNFIVN